MPYFVQAMIVLVLIAVPTVYESHQTEFLKLTKGEENVVELPTVLSQEDIDENALEQVRLIGRYTQIDVRKRPSASPIYNGHVALLLDDGTEVLLYPIWHSEAKRSADEIAQYQNRKVIVIGTIFPKSPGSPDNVANLVMPCLTEVKSIQLAQP